MKYVVLSIIAAVWVWSYFRVIHLANRYLKELYSVQIDIEQYAPQTGRIRMLAVAPFVYGLIVFRTIKGAIVRAYASVLIWFYDKKNKEDKDYE